MAGITPAKFAKSLVIVGAAVEQHIATATAQASKYRDLLYLLKGLEAPVRTKNARGGATVSLRRFVRRANVHSPARFPIACWTSWANSAGRA